MAGEPVIRIRDLDFAYPGGSFRLVIPELDIAAGERTAFVGPSGSGKTTLIHLIAGILAPEQGALEVLGETVSGMPDRDRRRFRFRNIGFVFQEFELIEYLDVLENITVTRRLHPKGLPAEAHRERAEELARACGLEALLARHPRKLSQGERQRVAVCRALFHAPPLLLADEPTGNLDFENTGEVMRLITAQAGNGGRSLVMVTHDQSLLDQFDRVIDFQAWLRRE